MIYRGLSTIFVLLGFLIFAPVALQAQKRVGSNTGARSAINELNAGNYHKLVYKTREFLNSVQESPETLSARAATYAKLFEKEIPPASENFLSAYSNVIKNSNNFRSARSDYQRATELAPQNTRIRNDFGWFLFNSGLPADALQQFNKALAIDANFIPAIDGRAKSEYHAGNFQGCVEAVNKFIARPELMQKQSIWAYFTLGDCYAEIGDVNNSRVNFDKALSLRPGLKGSWIYMAVLSDNLNCGKTNNNSSNLQGFDRYLYYRRLARCSNGSRNSEAWRKFAESEQTEENLKMAAMGHFNRAQQLTGQTANTSSQAVSSAKATPAAAKEDLIKLIDKDVAYQKKALTVISPSLDAPRSSSTYVLKSVSEGEALLNEYKNFTIKYQGIRDSEEGRKILQMANESMKELNDLLIIAKEFAGKKTNTEQSFGLTTNSNNQSANTTNVTPAAAKAELTGLIEREIAYLEKFEKLMTKYRSNMLDRVGTNLTSEESSQFLALMKEGSALLKDFNNFAVKYQSLQNNEQGREYLKTADKNGSDFGTQLNEHTLWVKAKSKN